MHDSLCTAQGRKHGTQQNLNSSKRLLSSSSFTSLLEYPARPPPIAGGRTLCSATKK